MIISLMGQTKVVPTLSSKNETKRKPKLPRDTRNKVHEN